MKLAYFVKTIQKNARGTKTLYRLEPPMEPSALTGDEVCEYVIVSALNLAFDTSEPETYIFPADEQGKITDYQELVGSFRGDTDNARALEGAGYTIAE